MPNDAIIMQELKKLLRVVIPIALIFFGGFVLLGKPLLQVGLGILLGTVFALWNFYLLGRSAVRAAAIRDPQRVQKLITHSYIRRYCLTAIFLIAVIYSGVIYVPAAVLPLFSPQIALFVLHQRRKEENHK